MGGGARAVQSGRALRDECATLGREMGLRVEVEVPCGRRVWGARRRIDLVFGGGGQVGNLGVECKYQRERGSAEEKIIATVADIEVWPIRGLVVFAGDGFSSSMVAYLLSTGRCVELADLREWLELYFRS